MIIGHEQIRNVLRARLPVVTLLTGPPSIGKRTLASHLADHHQVNAVDRQVISAPLTASQARKVVAFSRLAPFGPWKLITIDVDGASPAALNVLLKTLEEPPQYTKFILIASFPVLPTIASRCTVFPLGCLTPQELTQILVLRGMHPQQALQAAVQRKGQIDLKSKLLSAELVERASSLLLALASGNRDLFHTQFENYEAGLFSALQQLLVEAITGQWCSFSQAQAHGFDRNPTRVKSLLADMAYLRRSAERLALRSALEPYLNPGS
jgi:hypothetical protein